MITAMPSRSYAQLTELTRVRGIEDNDIPLPQPIDAGRVDASAVAVVTAFLLQLNHSSWPNMQASGTMNYLTSANPSTQSANLTVQDRNHLRLDLDNAGCTWSARISFDSAGTGDCNGLNHAAPTRSVASGLSIVPELFFINQGDTGWAIADAGSAVVEGAPLHRITIQPGIPPSDLDLLDSSRSPIDLYFDPSSHLLVKSVEVVHPEFTDRATYVDVTSFGGYQVINGALWPTNYRHTRNGVPQWSLTLSTILIGEPYSDSYFAF